MPALSSKSRCSSRPPWARRSWLPVSLGVSACYYLSAGCAAIAGLEDHQRATDSSGGGGTASGGTRSGGRSGSAGKTGSGASAAINGGSGGEAGDTTGDRPPSCSKSALGTGLDCGVEKDQDCCASPLIEGGPFSCTGNVAVVNTVEPFRLDKFEVTVGRFRAFAEAVENSWRPAPGSGQHPAGANQSSEDSGWEPAWNAKLPSGLDGDRWQDYFELCDKSTWTQLAGEEREWLPISCVDYYAALAFCIWDGGFLPSAVEAIYAASGGDNNWKYPWGNGAIHIYRAVYADEHGETPLPVGSVPEGDGLWGHSDLVGNVWEWCAYNARPAGECTACDCNRFAPSYENGVAFGGSYEASAAEASSRSAAPLFMPRGSHHRDAGIRCARAP